MRAIFCCCLLTCVLAACRITSTGGPGDPMPVCAFATDTIENHMNKPYPNDGSLDSTRSYTYFTQQVNVDSLLTALCSANVHVDSAYYVTEYLCKDMRGPRPVVVLAAADASMLNRGFVAGASGRLGCASKMVLYEAR